MRTYLLILSTLLTLGGCGKKEASSTTTLADPGNNGNIINKLSQNGDWVVKERISREGDVSYKEETLPRELVNDIVRKEYRNTQMSQVSVNPRFNTQLFRIEGKDTNNAVFVAPKIYSFSGNEVSRMQPLVNDADGTMVLFFPIMLIDGLSSSVISPDSQHESINIPSNMMVQDLDGLNQFIQKKYAGFGEQTLARLSGCPKEIIMTVAGKQYNIASDILKSSDYCDYNTPIYTSIKLPKKEALWLLQDGLYSGAAQITAIFETRVPYTVSKFSIEMNKSKLYEEIAAKLRIKSLYAEVDLQAEIVQIVKKQAMKISIQGNMTDHLDSIVRQAIDQFFEKIPADPAKADMSCGKAPVCLKLSYTKQTYEENLSVEWVQTSDVLSGQNITTWARLFPLTDANVRFYDLRSNLSRSTELVLMENDLVNFKITRVTTDHYAQDKKVNLTHNSVLVGHSSCHAIDIKYCPPIFEDQWVEETVFSVVRTSDVVDNPIGKLDTITDDMFFGFNWLENGNLVKKECSTNSFQRTGDGRSLILRINNVPGCEIFTTDSTNKPKLYVVNKGNSSSISLMEGSVVKNWRGEIVDSTKTHTYTSDSGYDGEISIQGYKVGNSDSPVFGSSIK